MLLFVDESGTDRREAPYEVLAGVAIRERDPMGFSTLRTFGRAQNEKRDRQKEKAKMVPLAGFHQSLRE